MNDPFAQRAYGARFDWGADGLRALAPVSDVVVIVDVLRFTTCVDVVVARSAFVLPYPWRDGGAAAFAAHHDAELAGSREDPTTRWSLSPTDLGSIPSGTRLVLPSPNGSALSIGAAEHGNATVLAGCLRNARAVADIARTRGGSVAVIAAGERWGSSVAPLRPSVEDLLGAGAVLSGLDRRRSSPEALAAIAAFEQAQPDLVGSLVGSVSGRELVARGRRDDVEVAAAFDVSDAAPVLRDGAYEAAR